MIRSVRIWTADDGNSSFEEGQIALPNGQRGDILLAEDTAGSGHRWKLVGEEPWRKDRRGVPRASRGVP